MWLRMHRLRASRLACDQLLSGQCGPDADVSAQQSCAISSWRRRRPQVALHGTHRSPASCNPVRGAQCCACEPRGCASDAFHMPETSGQRLGEVDFKDAMPAMYCCHQDATLYPSDLWGTGLEEGGWRQTTRLADASVSSTSWLIWGALYASGFDDWEDVIQGWGSKMLAAVSAVAELAAEGFGLPRTAFSDLMACGPHLLAPTGEDSTVP